LPEIFALSHIFHNNEVIGKMQWGQDLAAVRRERDTRGQR
jgi:hypothetical protein